MTKILLVCRANICRSPMALAVTAQHLAQAQAQHAGMPHLRLCAAGTHADPRSRGADPRALLTLQRHGYTPSRQRTRALVAQDFERFDQILAMDCSNLAALQALCPPAQRHKLQLFLHRAHDEAQSDIPDPYYGAPAGFERVLHLCEAGARAWVAHWLGDRPEPAAK